MHSQSSSADFDLLSFLKSLNFEEYYPNLQKTSTFDYSSLTDADLISAGIAIRLHRIKILEGLHEYHSSQFSVTYTDQDLSQSNSQSTIDIHDFSYKSSEKMILKGISGYSEGLTFIIGETGAKIGRGNGADVVLSDGYVSRKHCEIRYDKESNEFLMFDTGSTTGTYLKIRDSFPLTIGTLFQTGICEFKVQNINYSLKGEPVSLELIKYEGPKNMPLIVSYGGTIGRAKECHISVPQDNMMSLIHANITTKNGVFCVEDLNSCNKSWVRLSAEGEFSEGFSLCLGDFIKIGTSIFIVENFEDFEKYDSDNLCKRCKARDSNSELLPCGHKFCLDCASRMIQCSNCYKVVKEIARLRH